MDPGAESEINVYCGPLTIKEIRHTLSLEKPVELIKRRASISESQPSRLVYSDSPTHDYLIRQKFFGNDDDLEVTFVSEYFTPNETRSSDSRYVTVGENQELDVAKIQDPHVRVSETCRSGYGCLEVEANDSVSKLETIAISSDDDYDDAINYLKKQRSSEIIELSDSDSSFEEQQIKTKIDKCISRLNLDDDPESEILNSSAINENQKSQSIKSRDGPESEILNLSAINKDQKPQNIKSHASDKSSSSSSFIDRDLVFEVRMLDPWNAKESKTEQSCSSEEAHDCQQTTHSHISVTSSPSRKVEESQMNRLEVSSNCSTDFSFNDTVEEMEIALKFGLDYGENNTSKSSDTSLEKSHLLTPESRNSQKSTLIKRETRLNVEVEKLQVSGDSSIDYGFNDTLEEIEMALQFGLDYKENNTSNSSGTSTEKSHVLAPKTVNPQQSKTLIPVKRSTRLKVEAQLKQLALTPTKDFKFKMPTKPVSAKKTPDAFKNIRSPVGLYIKNSPQVPQVRSVRLNSVKVPLFPPAASTSTETNKENELPPCIYRPAKSVIVTQEKELKLPGSIQKYVPSVKVIKHQIKITTPKNASEVEEKLLSGDLTMLSSDDSHSESVVQNTSLHTIRNAF